MVNAHNIALPLLLVKIANRMQLEITFLCDCFQIYDFLYLIHTVDTPRCFNHRNLDSIERLTP